MDAYRQVLQRPGVLPVLVLGFFARIPFASLGLLLTLHCVMTLGRSYLEAGIIVTVSTLGTAIANPWRGRLVDTKGLRRAVLPSILIQSTTLIAAAFVPFSALIGLAFLGGLFGLPVWSVMRTSLSVLIPPQQRRTAFALDSVGTELVFMIGPAAITVAAISAGTTLSLVVVGVLVALAGIGLFIVNPPTRSEQLVLPVKLPKPLEAAEAAMLAQHDALGEKRLAEDLATGQIPVVEADAPTERVTARSALLTAGGMTILLAMGIGSLIFTATDLSIVAMLDAQGRTGAIAVVMSLWAAGSLVGGLVYGAMTRAVPPLWVLLGLGTLSLPVAIAGTTGSLLALALTVMLAGVCVAPIITATSESISHRVPEEVRGEAMGWHGTSLTVGAAAGSPVIGAVIDAFGPGWGVAAASLLAIVFAIAALIAQRSRRRRLRRELAARFA